MGIKKKEVIECTCDVCGKSCDPNETHIDHKMSKLKDGIVWNIGYLKARVKYYTEYGYVDGVFCEDCKVKYLEQYLHKLKDERNKKYPDIMINDRVKWKSDGKAYKVGEILPEQRSFKIFLIDDETVSRIVFYNEVELISDTFLINS